MNHYWASHTLFKILPTLSKLHSIAHVTHVIHQNLPLTRGKPILLILSIVWSNKDCLESCSIHTFPFHVSYLACMRITTDFTSFQQCFKLWE